jgi:SAM-dependent methyltransferase
MELLRLLWLRLAVMWRNGIEFCRDVWRFYGNPGFRKVDLAIIRKYILRNPYRLCRKYLQQIGLEDPYLYGETPLTTLQHIVDECDIKQDDVVYELGCGRGRGCFWLNAFVKCRVVGIELVPIFVDIAEQVRKRYDVKDVEFQCGDIREFNYENASVIYMYGTCFDDEFIVQLIDCLSKVPKGTKIITVSYALTEYTKKPLFEVIKTFPAKYTWGEAEVFLQVRK